MQELDAVGIRQLNLTGWQRSTFVENPHLKRLSLSRPTGSDAKFGSRLESKTRVVVRVAIDHNKGFTLCLCRLKCGTNDGGASPFSVMLWQHSGSRKHESRLAAHHTTVDQRVRSRHRLKFRIWNRRSHAKNRITWNPAVLSFPQRVHQVGLGVSLKHSLENSSDRGLIFNRPNVLASRSPSMSSVLHSYFLYG